MPVKVSNRLIKGVAVLLASMMTMSGCSAVGVAGTATDVLQEKPEAKVEESRQETSDVEKGYDASIAFLWVVDEQYSLPKTYEPDVVSEIGDKQVLAEEAADSYISMQRGMNIDGAGLLKILRGYCSWEDQEKLITERSKYYRSQGYSVSKAETFAQYDCGVPGASYYQTGLAAEVQLPGEEAHLWLRQHSFKYGFVYEHDGETVVLRYVGEMHAAAMEQLGVDFEDYIRYLDMYKKCTFVVNGVDYQVELVSDLAQSDGTMVSVCSDNRGGYIIIKRLEA